MKKQPDSVAAAAAAAASHLHRRVAALEEQCARLKQQKRVAEKFATDTLAAKEAQTARAEEYKKREDQAKRRADHQEALAEQRLGEVHYLRRRDAVCFQTKVEQEVFRAIEATGDPQVFPHTLMPTLAAVQSSVAAGALQQRAARLADLSSHPMGFHPGVHEYSFATPCDFHLLQCAPPIDFSNI